jgi:hypothetical protein
MNSIRAKNLQSSFASLILMAFVVLACKTPENKSNSLQPLSATTPELTERPTSNLQPLEEGVVLNFKVEINGTREPKIFGDTNLPDGTELMFSIEGKSVRYNGQDKATVQNGRFQSKTFSKDNTGFEAGQYIAEVSMPIPAVQSPAVRSVIGEQGENLKGSLVRRGNLGVTVSLGQPFQLKADGTISLTQNKSAIANAEKNAFAVFDALRRLEQQGRSTESLRSNQSIEKIRECGNLMRERQLIADDLRSKAESLPQPYSFLLGTAAIELKLCVSCSSFAIDNCDRAKSSLDQAAKEMQKSK